MNAIKPSSNLDEQIHSKFIRSSMKPYPLHSGFDDHTSSLQYPPFPSYYTKDQGFHSYPKTYLLSKESEDTFPEKIPSISSTSTPSTNTCSLCKQWCFYCTLLALILLILSFIILFLLKKENILP